MKNTTQQKTEAPKSPPTRESIIAEYQKLVIEKLKAGVPAADAEKYSFLQLEHEHGQKEARAALVGVVSESAQAYRQSDPFSGFGRADVPVFAPPEAPLKRELILPPNFRQLVGVKRKAGLSRDQAERVVRAQLEHDAQLAEVSAEAATNNESPIKSASA